MCLANGNRSRDGSRNSNDSHGSRNGGHNSGNGGPYGNGGNSGNGNRSNNRGRHNGGGGGRNRGAPRCQICREEGHYTIDCRERYNHAHQSDNHRSGNMVTYGHRDNNWYLDTGATDHLTSDLDCLTMHERYGGKDQVQVANGAEQPEELQGTKAQEINRMRQLQALAPLIPRQIVPLLLETTAAWAAWPDWWGPANLARANQQYY
nr:N66 matrix protein-like [Aegilops tauschii subsp. strangulata]